MECMFYALMIAIISLLLLICFYCQYKSIKKIYSQIKHNMCASFYEYKENVVQTMMSTMLVAGSIAFLLILLILYGYLFFSVNLCL
jgi:hypothetical protein